MGIRFRKRIKLAPGLHFNLSGSGLSMSAGPRGASMTFGGRGGTHMNTGIPGTGLYARERVGGTGSSMPQSRAQAGYETVKMSVTISVEDDGTVVFRDKDGVPLNEDLIKQVKEQHKDAVRGLMETACSEINGQIDALEQIHRATPAPTEHLTYAPQPYDAPKPPKSAPREYGLLDKLVGSRRARIDKENADAEATYNASLLVWNRGLREHEAREHARKDLIEKKVLTELPAMEIVLEESLMDIVWPRETALSSEIRDDGRVVMIDVDLPEIEELPRKTAAVPARGYKLSVKELPVTRHQQLYMRHVHGIGFRIIGEAFYALPKAEEVVLSGYSQRPDKATGEVQDQYLYSVRVGRQAWAGINFANLENVDAAEALGLFDIRREMSKTGLFKGIVPFDGPAGAGSTQTA
jgi:hypothetical protein